MNEPKPRTALGRLAQSLGLSMREVPSPPGTAPWEEAAALDLQEVAADIEALSRAALTPWKPDQGSTASIGDPHAQVPPEAQ